MTETDKKLGHLLFFLFNFCFTHKYQELLYLPLLDEKSKTEELEALYIFMLILVEQCSPELISMTLLSELKNGW